MVGSMSGVGQCWDNAPMESFFASLKKEMWCRPSFVDETDAERAVFESIEVFDNRERLHSSLDYVSPAAVESRQPAHAVNNKWGIPGGIAVPRRHPVPALGAGAGRDADPAVVRADARRSAASGGEGLLDRGTGCGCAKTAGVCRETLAVEASLWTFAGRDGVEPTNNAADPGGPPRLCWRETSYGTGSERGSRFVERMLKVVASCRQQGRGILDFMVKAVTGQKPSLLPEGAERLRHLTSVAPRGTVLFLPNCHVIVRLSPFASGRSLCSVLPIGTSARHYDGLVRRDCLHLGVAGMAGVGLPDLLRAKEQSAARQATVATRLRSAAANRSSNSPHVIPLTVPPAITSGQSAGRCCSADLSN